MHSWKGSIPHFERASSKECLLPLQGETLPLLHCLCAVRALRMFSYHFLLWMNRSIFRRTAAALTEVSTFSLFNNHPVLGSKLEAFATGLCDLFHAEGAGIDPSRMEGDIQPLLRNKRGVARTTLLY
mmetsp:Transcript_28035/g.71439  ORF Transcript_28035/g.71439 Transcript_28035/m.71439 type:complete len:127 (-) Transcript_28035:513-893(-)